MTSVLILGAGFAMWLIAWAAVTLSAANAREAQDHDALEIDGDDPRLVEAVRKELDALAELNKEARRLNLD